MRNFSSLADATTRTRNTGDTDETLIQWQLQRLVIEGTIEDDYHQRRAAVELDRLRNDLLAQSPVQIASSSRSGEEKAKIESSAGSLFSSWLGGIFKKDEESTVGKNPINAPKGAYLYGGPGCGKTFLMNRFYDAVDTGPWASDKQKVHYHKFMLSVHQQMHEARQQKKDGDPNDILPPVIDRIAKGGRLLCLDEFQVNSETSILSRGHYPCVELLSWNQHNCMPSFHVLILFQVTDVADALILRRLFMGLWDRGCVLVATSNRPPEDLYLHGLQRDRFLPLIAEIGQRCVIINMSGSETDYRMMLSANESRKVYFYNKEERPEFDKLFHTISKGGGVRPTTLETQGRKVKIPMASETKRVCRFTFDDLCKKALGAADYLVIGQQYHTVFVDGIPKMTVNELNWLRRFITFVDTMYELRVTVIIWNYPSSIYEIFQVDNKEDYTQDEVFAFDRTLSRLEEMASQPYLQSQWLGASTPRGKIRNSLFLVPSQ